MKGLNQIQTVPLGSKMPKFSVSLSVNREIELTVQQTFRHSVCYLRGKIATGEEAFAVF